MLSTLIQSEAAIFGLVITLSLVAVQQSATSYSPKVIGVFKDPRINLDFYILSFTYISLIIYEIWVLKEVNKQLSSLERHIQISFSVTIFAFLSLILYTLNILDLLGPIKIIEVLSKKVTRKNTVGFVNNEYTIPIQPLIDIVKASLFRYDYETSTVGIKAISDVSLPILKDNSWNENDLTKITENLLRHVEDIFKFAVIQKDQDTVLEILEMLKKIGLVVTKKKCNNATIQVLLSVNKITRVLLEYEMKSEAKRIIKILDEIGEGAISKNMDFQVLEIIISPLNQIKDFAIECNYTDLLHTVVVSISKIGKAIWIQNKTAPIIGILQLLRDILKYSVKMNLKFITIEVENIFVNLVKDISEINNENIILEVIQVQKEIGELILKNKNNNLIKIYKSALEDIKNIAINHNMKNIENKIENLVASTFLFDIQQVYTDVE